MTAPAARATSGRRHELFSRSSSPRTNTAPTSPSTDRVSTPGPLRPWMIAGGYLVGAGLWILFSDRALGWLVSDPDLLVRYGSVKGIGFVVVTAALLWWTIARAFARTEAAQRVMAASEHDLRRVSTLYQALSQINQTIVRRPRPDEIFAETCRILVDECGFTMAWIGRHDTYRRLLVPVASHGSTGYLDDIVVYTDDRPEGHGPSGTAMREGRPYICHDMLTDASMEPWRDSVVRHDVRSLASLPLEIDGALWGALNVYAAEPGRFGEQEIDLLAEVAVDIAHAVENSLLDADRERAEAAVRQERQFSDTMIDSMPGVLYFYDTAGRFLRWNRNFETVSGYSSVEVAEMHPLDFFAGHERDTVAERIQDVFEHGEASVAASFVHRDGTTTPYFFTGRRVEYEGRTCLVGVGIDITDRVRAETALREMNVTLESKVAERTEELRTALIRAEAADQLKSAFLATMSHELRTPLNSIIGFTGIVLQELAGPLTDEQTTQLGMVRASARHLLALINDVLDISKIEAGQLEVRREPFDLGETVRRCTESIRQLATQKGLDVHVAIDRDVTDVVSDPRRTQQIVLNLLSNAVKFTDAGSVSITARCVPAGTHDLDHPGDVVEIAVTDTGIGIAPDDLAGLFQPFHQIDNGLTRQHEGTGLGLAICRRLSELMGGSVSATSELGIGSRFALHLPVDGRLPA